jgi:hypothetical protein
MSAYEKQAWASLIASALIWWFFAVRMIDGGAVAGLAVRHVLWTYVAVVVLMIVSHAVIAALLAVTTEGTASGDERTDAIEARGDRIEGYVVQVAVNLLVIYALAGAAWPGISLPSLKLGSVATLVFALLSALLAGHVAKQAAIIWMYRR